MFEFGINWGEQHHNLCIRNSQGAIVSQVEFKHTLEGFQRFDDERRKLGVPPSECLVAIETATICSSISYSTVATSSI
jgi:hypothetical protein